MPSRKEENEVIKAFDDNYVVPMGPNVEQLERELEAFVNEAPDQVRGDGGLSKRVVALSCGTVAVHLALINCGVKAGDARMSIRVGDGRRRVLRNPCSWKSISSEAVLYSHFAQHL